MIPPTSTGEGLDPVVLLDRVCRSFAPFPSPNVLDEVSLRVFPGDYLAILGRSGSGKSTLLNLVGLLDRPTAGRYLFNGISTEDLTEVERTGLRGNEIGFVFQDFHLLNHRSVSENVALGRLYIDTDARRRRRFAIDALERVGLAHRADALPSTLSGGERQRVAIARALVSQPTLLLCDEPTGSLDSSTAAQILDLFEELNSQQVTLIVITHDPATAARASQRAVLRDGTLSRPAPPGQTTEMDL